ncbi:sensor domain-containing protein [Paenibacillus ginsengarvi]|nr:sensor domain-containing protein [Paenibacillus ginsengarvi]
MTNPADSPKHFIDRYGRQAFYTLIVTLPLSLIGFVFSVTLLALGIGLSPLFVGLPLMQAALYAARGLMAFDQKLMRRTLSGSAQETLPPVMPHERIKYRDFITTPKIYAPLLYWLLKLPVALLQFAAAVTFVLAGICIVLAPAVYMALNHYGIEIFGGDDIVLSWLLPDMEPFQRSWIVAAVGSVIVAIGFGVLNQTMRSSTALLADVVEARPKQEAADYVPGLPVEQYN